MVRTRSQSRKRTSNADPGEGVSEISRAAADLSDPFSYGRCTTTSIECPMVVVGESDPISCILETGVHTLASALLQIYDYGFQDQLIPPEANTLLIWFTALHMRASFLGETLLLQPLIPPDMAAGTIAQQERFHQQTSKLLFNIGWPITVRHQDTEDFTLMSISVDYSQSKLAVSLWDGWKLHKKTITEAHKDQIEYTLQGSSGMLLPCTESMILQNFLPWELPKRPLQDIAFWLLSLTSTLSPEDVRLVIVFRYRPLQYFTIYHVRETIRWLARGDTDYPVWVIGMSQSETDRRRKATVNDVKRAKVCVINNRVI